MEYFSEIYGLVTKNDPTTENGGLFLAHYVVLRMMLKENSDPAREIYFQKMFNAYVSPGLYLRSKNHTKRTVSQDEITGFLVTSFWLNSTHKDYIANVLKGENYPATGEDKHYNPGDYYSWDLITEGKSTWLRKVWYTVNLLITTNKPKGNTTGKLVYLDELYTICEINPYAAKLWKYYQWRMKFMYGEKWIYELFKIYFGKTESEDFPLLELAKKL